ncbi:MAG: hypothetical protein ABI333_09465 [bacterium]
MGWPVAIALAITLAIEVPVVAALYSGQRRRMALACAASTTVTNLAMNLLLVRVMADPQQALLCGEILALVLEAVTYIVVSRTRDVGRALVASGLANALSFGAGWLVYGM